MNESAPGRLGRYEIEAEIGRGMMGVVYRAVDPELHRTVALKTVRLAWATSVEEREGFEQRFINEARTAARLQHPGIVVVHDVGRDAATGTLYIALEFLEGRTLGEMTAGGTSLPWREALRLVARVAEALGHAHEKGVVHRDVKPANIMVLPSGDPKIMDFGIAKVPTAQLTAAGEFFGTPSYMSPEQAAAGVVDGRSDLFSLGAVLYLLLSGRRAFDASAVTAILTKVAAHDPTPPSKAVPGLPDALDYVVARTLSKKPEDRYPDGRSLAEDAQDILEGRPPRHRPGWREPPRAEGTLLSSELIPVERDTEDLGKPTPAHATLNGNAPTLRRDQDRRLFAIGGAALLLLVGILLYARRETPRAGTASDAARAGAEPAANEQPTQGGETRRPAGGGLLPRLFETGAKLELSFEHSLKSGRLRVYVDDQLALERELSAPVTRKIVLLKKRKQVIDETLELRAGEHMVRLQVTSGDDVYTSRIGGSFEEGETRRLAANLGGLFGKDIELVWGASAE